MRPCARIAAVWLVAVLAFCYAANAECRWYAWQARDLTLRLLHAWADPARTLGALLVLGVASTLAGLVNPAVRRAIRDDPALGFAIAALARPRSASRPTRSRRPSGAGRARGAQATGGGSGF